MGTKTQKQRKCCYHNLNAKQLIHQVREGIWVINAFNRAKPVDNCGVGKTFSHCCIKLKLIKG
jgi:hypothetical protein